MTFRPEPDEASADWCAVQGELAICGTRMEEYSRSSVGEKWCFHCRRRHEFWWVVSAPAGISYYGPSADMKGVKSGCSDLFPGWSREGGDW